MGKRGRRKEPNPKLHKTSVAAMAIHTIKNKMGYLDKKSQKHPTGIHSRSFAPRAMKNYENILRRMGVSEEQSIGDRTFFDVPISTSRNCLPPVAAPVKSRSRDTVPTSSSHGDEVDMVGAEGAGEANSGPPRDRPVTRSRGPQNMATNNRRASGFIVDRHEGRKPSMRKKDEDRWDLLPDWIEDHLDNSDRHAVGVNLVSGFFGAGTTDIHTRRTRRPYFTYWVTVVQIIIYIIVLATYGTAPLGVGSKTSTDQIKMPSLMLETVSRTELRNMWIGPRRDDLIHLGAKYSLCMRQDENVQEYLDAAREVENGTACCIFNDGSGCVQRAEDNCSPLLNTWYKYTATSPGYENRLSGSVCGQDPQFCLEPASSGAHVWKDDITQWPTCTRTENLTSFPENVHMTCELTGRPCCVGIQGECIITSREYCDFHRGYFHEDKTLCSQVSCLQDICGQIEFLDPDKPDQIYRLLTSLFLHAGLLQLLITVVYQLLIQRDFEKIIGWWRMAIIYLGSGAAGSLGSCIFIPYYVESGPGSAQFGVLALLCVEVIRWNTDDKEDKPLFAFLKLLGLIVLLFFFGFIFPQLDNYAHVFGFCFGMLLSIGLQPFTILCMKPVRTCTRVVCVVLGLGLAVGLFAMLVILFYVAPVYNCEDCWRLNCIPFSDDYCDGMEVELGSSLIAA